MSDQLQTETVAALGDALKIDPAQFQEFMSQNYPDVATRVQEMNGILPRFQSLVAGMERNVNNIQTPRKEFCRTSDRASEIARGMAIDLSSFHRPSPLSPFRDQELPCSPSLQFSFT